MHFFLYSTLSKTSQVHVISGLYYSAVQLLLVCGLSVLASSLLVLRTLVLSLFLCNLRQESLLSSAFA